MTLSLPLVLLRVVIAAGDFNCSREAIDSAKILDDPVTNLIDE